VVIVLVMVALSFSFLVVNRRITLQYAEISDRLIIENRFAGLMPELLDAYFEVVNAGPEAHGRYDDYQTLRSGIFDHIESLDRTIIDEGSRAAYRGLRNFVINIVNECDLGVAAIRQNKVSEAWEIYTEEISPMRPFVYENAALLLVQELSVAEDLERVVKEAESRLDWLYLFMFLLIIVVNSLVIMFMTGQVTGPMSRLTNTAKQISDGNLDNQIDGKLLKKEDEIGSLSRSVASMLDRLKSEIELQKKTSADMETSRVEFISIASHQLKTPITALKWNIDMLREKADLNNNKDVQGLLLDATEIVATLSELVNSLLNVSRIELGNYAVIPEPVSLKEKLDEVIGLVKAEVASRGLNISVIVDEGMPVSYDADIQLLVIIYQNLISNAVKYTKDKGKISISLLWKPEGVVFEVKDNGIGIPQEQQSKIFTKMFRADNTAATEGTGLGLFIIKKTVENIGGSVGFISKEGAGSTFTVTLPKDGMVAKAGTRKLT